ncbi:Smr domain-containing protein C11H11.03c [Cladobotryum mycophilum]|uniref:Smr domain-containing protein C11H11.03c n=1 Tax=Cladobotryum mycophilum TaxID=491253 RepID=A0ABR0SBK1_9HYPO
MSIPMTSLGGRALNHGDNDEAEREYDRLRDAARAEAQKRNDCYDRSHRAYENGDGAKAKELSNEGKAHDAKMKDFNRQASEYIFRENNAAGRVEPDCIDLHGQFVEEAERIVEQRIRADQQRGQTHLHVIVGKGNHSANHVQKIKPKVEEMCREMGLKYNTEENAGRIYINLQGGEAIPLLQADTVVGMQQQQQQQHYDQQHQGQQHHGQQQQQHQQQDQMGELVEAVLPTVLRKLQKMCCVVM